METRLIIFASAIILLALPGFLYAKNIRDYNEKELFYNFSYSICIASAFDVEEVKSDANRAASAYVQFGNISIEAYEDVSNKANTWLKKEYRSKTGKSLQIMKCIDFINSGEVEKVFSKYHPRKK